MSGQEQYRVSDRPDEEVSGAQLHMKQRIHSRNAQEATFDSAHRKDYLKGFRKRKTERKQLGKKIALHKDKLAKTEAKKQRNQAIYGAARDFLEEWDQEHESDEKAKAASVSETAEADVLEFGEGDAATTVSIEPWTGEDSDDDSGGGGGAEEDTDDYGSAGILTHASTEMLLSSKAKKAAWKPNSIKIGHDGKGKAKLRQQWGDKTGNVEDDEHTKLLSAITYADEGTKEDDRPDWWKKSRSNRPAVSLGKQKRQKFIQSKNTLKKSNAFKMEKKMIKKMGGGKRGRGLKLMKGTASDGGSRGKGKGKKNGSYKGSG